jgi:hypothetical protein
MPRKKKPAPRGLNVARHLFAGKRIIRDKVRSRDNPRNEDIGKGSMSALVPTPAPPRAVDIYGN